MVKTNAQGEREIIVKKGTKITAYKVTGKTIAGDGERLGTAYRLANGQIIYVPERYAMRETPLGAARAPLTPLVASAPAAAQATSGSRYLYSDGNIPGTAQGLQGAACESGRTLRGQRDA